MVAALLSLSSCPSCDTPLKPSTQPGFYLCPNCEIPLFSGNLSNAFDVMGAPRTFKLDEGTLQSRYYELSKFLHPDRYTQLMKNSAATKQWIQKISAAANDAYLALKSKESRLESLVEDSGYHLEGDNHSSRSNQIPIELAEQYFELQDALTEDPVQAKLLATTFHSEVSIKRDSLTEKMYAIAEQLPWPMPPDADRLKEIVELRRKRSYLISMLENLERLGV